MISKKIFEIITGPVSRWKNFLGRKKQSYITEDWRDLPLRPINNNSRVGWVLAGNEQVGSSRLKGILLNRYAHENACGFLSNILYMPFQSNTCLNWQRYEWQPILKRVDVLVLQTWTGSTLELLEDCWRRRVAVVFTLSDLEFHKVPQRLFELIDAVVVSSEKLNEEASKFHKRVFLIDDPIEVPSGLVRKPVANNGVEPELVWMGHPNNWPETDFIRRILDRLEFADIKLRTITKHPEATYQWNLDTRWKDVSQSDIAVIPCKLDEWGISKSSNRLASFMTLGYPVIARPIPSYKKFIENGVNGFFAVSERDWIECIRLLRDPYLRNRVGNAARETPALQELKIENVIKQWANLFKSLRDLKKI